MTTRAAASAYKSWYAATETTTKPYNHKVKVV